MSIVLVGGHDRMHETYRTIGKRLGHRIKVFTQMATQFDKAIGTPDAIVLFTSTVSHGMSTLAVKEARRKQIPVYRCHTSSGASLQEMLRKLEEDVACH